MNQAAMVVLLLAQLQPVLETPSALASRPSDVSRPSPASPDVRQIDERLRDVQQKLRKIGTVTMGTTATGCVITFNVAYVAAPHCTVTWQATPLVSQSYTVSNTAITLTQTATSGDLVNYICVAQSGG